MVCLFPSLRSHSVFQRWTVSDTSVSLRHDLSFLFVFFWRFTSCHTSVQMCPLIFICPPSHLLLWWWRVYFWKVLFQCSTLLLRSAVLFFLMIQLKLHFLLFELLPIVCFFNSLMSFLMIVVIIIMELCIIFSCSCGTSHFVKERKRHLEFEDITKPTVYYFNLKCLLLYLFPI